MDRINQHISQKLMGLLPADEKYYRLGNLREWGFPSFVVRRIQVELERNLAESIVPPRSDWAYMQADTVERAWEQFYSAIHAEARLPVSHAHSIVETAVEDIVNLLVQPRKNLPEAIFGASEELSKEEITRRMNSLVVYRHFASLIPRYMEKKSLEKLDKKRFEAVIIKADERLTAHYSPLNWAQMLEPLFTLLDEQIDTNLLWMFFEDKKMPGIARGFHSMNKSLNRAQLIEALSSPELLDTEGYDEKKSDLPEEKQPPDQNTGRPAKPAGAGGNEQPGKTEKGKPGKSTGKKQVKEGDPSNEDQQDPILSSFHKSRGNPEEENNEHSLNTIFGDPGENIKTPEEKEKVSLNEVFSEEPDEKEGPPVDEKVEDNNTNKDREDINKEGRGEEKKETPMWQRFMSPEERAEAQRLEQLEEQESDLTTTGEPDESTLNRLKALLDDDRDRFVKKIFGGADRAYEEAVKEIALKEDWRSASRFIEKEVFKRNMVDVYSEVAVDFTDRLQTFFVGKNKSKA